MTIEVGQTIKLGWNGSKYFNEILAYESVRVEAVGIDWIAVRDSNGRPWAAGFLPDEGHESMLQELTS